MKSIIFWDMTLACWFAEPISLTLKMEAICSSETSVETQLTTRHHITEDDTLDEISYRLEHLDNREHVQYLL
jgi:hypothetical protein